MMQVWDTMLRIPFLFIVDSVAVEVGSILAHRERVPYGLTFLAEGGFYLSVSGLSLVLISRTTRQILNIYRVIVAILISWWSALYVQQLITEVNKGEKDIISIILTNPITGVPDTNLQLVIYEVIGIMTLFYYLIDLRLAIINPSVFFEHNIQIFLERNVPLMARVLSIFWIIRATYEFLSLLTMTLIANFDQPEYEPTNLYVIQSYLSVSEIVDIHKQVLITGWETGLSLLGMTSVISYVTYYMGLMCISFIKSDYENNPFIGARMAFLFLILSLWMWLEGLNPTIRLYRMFCILSTGLLHSFHDIICAQLKKLSTTQSQSTSKLRAFTVCLVLITLPCSIVYYLWSQHSVSTWLLTVTASSVHVVLKVIISLLIYALFMIEPYLETVSEKLDDYVYYIESAGNFKEFLFGIFHFFNGAWIVLFETGSMIQALIMSVDAYFHIWKKANRGWKVFIRRRNAGNKINSLTEATEQQLCKHDVCAICYENLTTARITPCNHMFHGGCLQKWLYVLDNCPLCHEPVCVTPNNLKPVD